MDILQSAFTSVDLIVLGLVALVPLLMALGIHAIRTEMRTSARLKSKPIRLKTSEDQRQRWRVNKTCHARDLIDLLDDIDTLRKLAQSGDAASQEATPFNRIESWPEHREAVRLSLKSHHIPIGTLVIIGLALVGVLSATFMVVAQGPSNPIP
jgi:hypothetical protein